jgi:arsenite methyltransferase
MRRRVLGSYGSDALFIPILSAIGAVGLVALGYTEFGLPRYVSYFAALLLVLQIVVFIHTTRRGRFLLWPKVLADVSPPETVLDVGCGRGMVLIEALLSFPQARGVGLDLWRSRDINGVARLDMARNLAVNGVSERAFLQIGDMAAMPFEDGQFDLVTANISIHDVEDDDTRRKAIAEIIRVTRPGGQIRIVDIHYTAEYQDQLELLGAENISTRSLGVNGWYGSPFYASRLVRASRPLVDKTTQAGSEANER